QRWVTTGEKERQALVRDALVFQRLVGGSGRQFSADCVEPRQRLKRLLFAQQGRVTTETGNRSATSGRAGAGGRALGNSCAGPLSQRVDKRILQRILGQRKVPNHADQRGEDTSRLCAKDTLHDERRLLHATAPRFLRDALWPHDRHVATAPGAILL